MAASNTIIGRVAVKVLPDTSDFRKDARAKLEKEEKRLKFIIPTTLDITGAKRDMLVELRKLNAENKTIDSRKVRLHTHLVVEGVRGQLAKFRRELSLITKSDPIKLHADLVAAEAKLVLNKDSLDHVKDQLQRWRKKVSPLKVQVKVEYGSASADLAASRLAYLTRPRTLTILPKLSKTAVAKVTGQIGTMLAALSGARMLNATLGNIKDMVKNLDKMIPLIALVGNAIMLIGAAALASSSNVFALVASIASIASLGLVLPGLLGGMTIGLVAAAVSLKDFNKEVPAFQIGMGRATKAGTAWKQLQDIMSKNFWGKAKKPMVEFIQTIFPQFAKGISGVSTQLGGFFGKLADGLKGKLNNALAGMFDDLGKSIDVASAGMDSFAGIIKTLGAVGGSYLPRLATWFVDILTKFDNFLAKADKDGRLKGWIDAGVTALNDLGRVFMGVFDIFADLGRAAEAAGGSTLAIFADTLERIHKVTSGKAFQKNLTQAFEAAHKAMQIIADTSGPALTKFFTVFSKTLTTLLPTAGRTVGIMLRGLAKALSRPAFQRGLTAMFEGIEKGVIALEPIMPVVGDALGALATIVGKLAENAGPLLAEMLGVLAQLFIDIAPTLETLIPLLGTALLDALETLAPFIKNITPILADMAGQLGVALVKSLEKILPLLPDLLQNFTDLLVALAPLLPDLVHLADRFTDLAVGAVPGLLTAMQWFIDKIDTMVGWIGDHQTAVEDLLLTMGTVWVAYKVAAIASAAVQVVQLGLVMAKWVLLGDTAVAAGVKMAAAWVASLGPIGLVIAALAAVTAALLWIGNNIDLSSGKADAPKWKGWDQGVAGADPFGRPNPFKPQPGAFVKGSDNGHGGQGQTTNDNRIFIDKISGPTLEDILAQADRKRRQAALGGQG